MSSFDDAKDLARRRLQEIENNPKKKKRVILIGAVVSFIVLVVLASAFSEARALEQFTYPGTISNYGNKRINLSNIGTYPPDSDIVWQGDAHRWYREKLDWNAPGNDASYVFSTRVNAIGPQYGPVHGGVWSELACSGGPSHCFTLMASGHRRGQGPMYGVQSEVWDESAIPGWAVLYNAEVGLTDSSVNPQSKYIGFNMQIGPKAENADGLQLQSLPGAKANNYNALITSDANARYGIDFGRVQIAPDGAVFNLAPNHTVGGSSNACNTADGYIKAKIGTRFVKIPYIYSN